MTVLNKFLKVCQRLYEISLITNLNYKLKTIPFQGIDTAWLEWVIFKCCNSSKHVFSFVPVFNVHI